MAFYSQRPPEGGSIQEEGAGLFPDALASEAFASLRLCQTISGIIHDGPYRSDERNAIDHSRIATAKGGRCSVLNKSRLLAGFLARGTMRTPAALMTR